MEALALPLSPPLEASPPRWFAANSCVIDGADGECRVFLAGTLVGGFGVDDADRGPRNILAVTLSKAPGMHLGQLATAFGMTDEYLRQLRRKAEQHGIAAVITGRGGGRSKLSAERVVALHADFAAGMTPKQATTAQPKKGRVSYQTIWREYHRWQESVAAARQASLASGAAQLELFAGRAAPDPRGASDEGSPIERLVSRAVTGGHMVQHVGTWLLMALCQRDGLYEEATAVDKRPSDGLRIALDAVIGALALGEKCVEGVRRLATPTAPLLLRADHTPTASGIRRRLARLGEDGGGLGLHGRMAERYLAAARTACDELAVFFVDNHLRPYTGDQVVRRGWRMQDRRVLPGATDYYVHDEDGRPVLRLDVPSHDSLPAWLLPIATTLRQGLGERQRILLAFDRAGSFPEDLAALRDAGFEWVTYQRKGYAILPKTAFRAVVISGEKVGLFEEGMRNLGKGRGRVRRIAVLVGERQVNFLASSRESAERLVAILWNRWVQENGFKHGVERWGINQLDGRKVEPYPAGTIIPNPQRRRLDRALRLARGEEGELRNRLADDDLSGPRRDKLEAKLREVVARRVELDLLRPFLPKKIAVEDSELATTLVRHTGDLKAVVDTVRIVCANVEADLAAAIAPWLKRSKEAKKVVANLLAAPGRVDAGADEILVRLAPAANRTERAAIAHLLAEVSQWNLTLPGDHRSRPIRLQLQVSREPR